MEQFITLFETVFGQGDLGLTAMVVVFISASLLFLSIFQWLMGGQTPMQRRLKAIAGEADERASHTEGEFEVHWVKPLIKIILPQEGWRRSHLKTQLVRAGYRSSQAINLFVSTKILLAVLLPILAILPFIVFRIPLDNPQYVALALVGIAIIGFYLPDVIVNRRINHRKRAFIEGFPDAMDLLVICVEAGLGLDAAIQRVGNEIGLTHPELANELSVLSLELRAGKSREEGLRSLAYRTGVDEVQSLTTLLIQAEHFGTSVASALRDHSKEMRIKRVQNAREKAAKLAVKLIFPVMLFIFPALFLVILGPALVRIYLGFAGVFHG